MAASSGLHHGRNVVGITSAVFYVRPMFAEWAWFARWDIWIGAAIGVVLSAVLFFVAAEILRHSASK